MTLFLRAMLLGFAVATGGAVWLSALGFGLWSVALAVWIGGNVLGVAFAATGALLWPAAPARRSSFTVTDAEFRLWDDDLARDLLDAELMRDATPAKAAESGTAAGRAAAASGQGARLSAAG